MHCTKYASTELEINDNQIRFSRTMCFKLQGMLIKDEFSEMEAARHQKRPRDSSCVVVGNRIARNGRFYCPDHTLPTKE